MRMSFWISVYLFVNFTFFQSLSAVCVFFFTPSYSVGNLPPAHPKPHHQRKSSLTLTEAGTMLSSVATQHRLWLLFWCHHLASSMYCAQAQVATLANAYSHSAKHVRPPGCLSSRQHQGLGDVQECHLSSHPSAGLHCSQCNLLSP